MDEQYLVRFKRNLANRIIYLFILETYSEGGRQKHVLLVLQEEHRQPEMRPRTIGLRLQGEFKIEGHHRQPEPGGSIVESQVRAVLRILYRSWCLRC